ncbi:MAG: class I SAM-dependent methyltransferase [Endozoicomonas sp.]|uniref:class I SAM-dependent methyltransferase n=1 Tax=Endozoicomonas sp. TaxID=1892382 RepID=UPI003D9BB4C7
MNNLLSRLPFDPTLHHAGYAFDVDNILLDQWLESWNSTHPLLDLGCGNCRNSRKAAEQGIKVVATEICEETLKAISGIQKNQGIDFRFMKLPDQVLFADESFSGILCAEVFHFLDHHEIIASLWELHRILVQGGQLFLTCESEEYEFIQPLGFAADRARMREQFPLHLGPLVDIYELLDGMSKPLPETHPIWSYMEMFKDNAAPALMNFLNLDQLVLACKRLGFEIESAGMGRADHYPVWVHGEHDQIRLILKKTSSLF